MNAIPEQIELDPLELDHGPTFYCPDDLETQIHLAAADLVRQWELADPRDRWRHTGEPKPKASDIPTDEPKPYRTAASTIDAFWYVVGLRDPEPFKAWLADHPQDAPFLLKLLEGK